jgi:hypothetical protein
MDQQEKQKKEEGHSVARFPTFDPLQSNRAGDEVLRQPAFADPLQNAIAAKQRAYEEQQQHQDQEKGQQQEEQSGQQRSSLTASLLPGSRSDLGSAESAGSKALPYSARALHVVLSGYLHSCTRTGMTGAGRSGSGSGSGMSGGQRRPASGGAGCRRVFVGLVWGALAVGLLFMFGQGVFFVVEEKDLPASFLLSNSTVVEEQQEFLRLNRNSIFCQAIVFLALGIEVIVNAWFSLHFFEQQVGAGSVFAMRIHLLIRSFVLTSLPLSLSHNGWSEWWRG